MYNGKEQGTLELSSSIQKGAIILFAGRRWHIEAVDAERRIIYVEPTSEKGRTQFFGGGGLVHSRVREEMFAVYTSDGIPQFLDATAREMLAEARAVFADYGLAETCLVDKGQGTLLFVWAGDKVANTIAWQLSRAGLGANTRDAPALSVQASRERLLACLRELIVGGPAMRSNWRRKHREKTNCVKNTTGLLRTRCSTPTMRQSISIRKAHGKYCGT